MYVPVYSIPRDLSFLTVHAGDFSNSLSSLLQFILHTGILQVRLCREKATSNVYAMKKLKKSEMLRRGQVLNSVNPSNYSTIPGYPVAFLFLMHYF